MDIEIAPRPVIAMDSVVSSQIDSLGHDAATNTLAVRFKPSKVAPNGSLYHYANFTAEDFANFKGAKSPGGYFKDFIKPHQQKYPYEKIE
jgi:hypothetical protein